MLTEKMIYVVLFIAQLLSGFYAGTGFFVAMGGNPAIRRMSDRSFAEYWQHTDYYMAARMKIFGPLLLIIMIAAVAVLMKSYNTWSFWLMVTALGILIADIVFTFSVNHPLNQMVQRWDLDRLPPNVSGIKGRIVNAFYRRVIFMISSFTATLLAVAMYNAGA